MDLDGIEGLNDACPAVYRAALKLRSLQKLCHMHMVLIRDLRLAILAVGDLGNISQESLKQNLEQLFQGVLHKLPVQVVPEATEQTARLLFKLYDREKTGFVLLRSVEAALIVLSGDTLSAKHRALFQLAVSCSRRQGTEDAFISRAGLRNLLDDLSQVPAVVQESHVFGPVEAAIQSCFIGAISGRAGEEPFVSWLKSEPRLLLWLSTLYRLSITEAVQHRVRCHACKAFPITGLRYRCLKCLNVHLCQNCFLTKKRTRKHKPLHPVLEYCTEPSWKESVASLASSARHVLLPRRYTRRETERRRTLIAGSNEETHDRCPLSLSAHVSRLQQQECVDNLEGLDIIVSENVPPSPPPPLQLNMESKSLQTDESDTQPQRKMSLLQKDLNITQNAMKDLQRDKGLLEKEFQVWKVAAQSEHDSLEDRCTELEATMEVLIQHNQQLEQELGQVRHALSMRGRDEFGSGIHTPLPQQHSRDDTSEKQFKESESPASYTSSTTEKDQETATGEVRAREQQMEEEEEPLNQVQEEGHIDVVVTETCVTETKKEVQLVGESEEEEEVEEKPHLYRQELIGNDTTLDRPVMVEDSGTDSSDEEEEELCDLVQRLHGALLSTPTGFGSRQKEALLQAAGGVGDSMFHLVTSLKSITSPIQDMEQGSANSGPHGYALCHQSLKGVFQWLGFSLHVHKNQTAEQIKDLLKTYSQKHHDGNCFICCIMSHGFSDGVYGTNGTIVSRDDIFGPFSGNSCPRLINKPKVFFIQVCRGKEYHLSVEIQPDNYEEEEVEVEMEDEASLEMDAVQMIALLADADFLVVRLTVKGYLSFRETISSSWFIQSLCKKLKKYCPKGDDVPTILLCVNKEVSEKAAKLQIIRIAKHLPVHKVTLRKKLVFRVPNQQ